METESDDNRLNKISTKNKTHKGVQSIAGVAYGRLEKGHQCTVLARGVD
jgi:hypothetical protein